jgi:hypothetical protein
LCSLAVPVQEWFNALVHGWQGPGPGQTSDLVLNGVPFGMVALLALDRVCNHVFSQFERQWTLIFRNSQRCAGALEVRFDTPRAANNALDRQVGIKMLYSHQRPGQLTVSMIAVIELENVFGGA